MHAAFTELSYPFRAIEHDQGAPSALRPENHAWQTDALQRFGQQADAGASGHLLTAGRQAHSVGKIKDIFAGRGISHSRKGEDNAALCEQTLLALQDCADGGLVFANLVDFDKLFGHRRDLAGYGQALDDFDLFLPRLLGVLQPGDLLALTADHDCDPTWPGTDHAREFVPLLFGGPACPAGLDLGVCDSFADLGQTLARHLSVGRWPYGKSADVGQGSSPRSPFSGSGRVPA